MKKNAQILFISVFLVAIYMYEAPSVSAAWSSDVKNYFNEWQCTSTIGINHIAKLDILPKSLYPLIHKDSLYADFRDWVGNNPTLHFSTTDSQSSWYMEKATYNTGTNNWDVSEVSKNPPPGGGMSSFDGTDNDYIMNEYLIPGWGPTANKPGSESKIPGVSQTHVYNGNIGYPLWGTGLLGLTTIRETIHDNSWSDPNTKTCLQMNPTLFDFDTNNIPHSFAAYLFTKEPYTGCTLPNGNTLQPGYYVYRFANNSIGWQLDLQTGLLDDAQAINYAWGSMSKFVTDEWNGKIQIVDANQSPPRTPKTVLDCTKGNVYITESSGKENIFYFLSGLLLPNLIFNHDIYVAFADMPQSTLPANLNHDGNVDIFDYNILVSDFGKTGSVGFIPADINRSGKVDIFDYNVLIGNFGK